MKIEPTPAETATQFLGFRPERLAGLQGERRTLQNIQANYTARRDADRTREVLEEVKAYNKDALKLRRAVPLIKSSGLRQAIPAKPNKAGMAFGRAMGTGAEA